MADIVSQILLNVESGDASTRISDIKKAIKELESVAVASGDTNSDAFKKATQAAGKLKDSLEDVKDATKTFKGDPLEGLSKGLGGLKGKLADLDFQGFNDEVGRLKTLSKQVSFKELAGSVGETGKSFLSLGKILLTNPLFLIASIVTTIITNFDKLATAGGKIGLIFSAIGDTVNFVIDKLKMLSDWLGLTDFKGQEKANNTLENASKEQKAIEARYDREIKVAQAAGKDVTQLELKKQEEIRANIQLQIDQLNYLAKSQGQLTKEQQENLDELNAQYQDSLTETAVITAGAQKKAADDAQAAADKAREKAEAAAEAARQKRQQEREKRKEDEQNLANEILAIQEEQYQATLDQFDKEARQIDLKYEKLISEAKRLGKDTSEIQKLYNAEILALNKKQGEDEAKQEAENQKKIQEEKDKAAEIAKNKEEEQARKNNDVRALQIELMKDGLDKELAQIRFKFDQEYKAAEGNAELQRLLKEKLEKDLTATEEKYDEIRRQSKLKLYEDTINSISSMIASTSEGFETLGTDILQASANIAGQLTATIDVFTNKNATAADKLVAGFQAASGAINEISNVLAAQSQRRLDEIAATEEAEIASAQRIRDEQIAAIDAQVENGVITKEEGDKRKAESEYQLKLAEFDANEKARKAEFNAKKKAFEQEKKARIASALAQGAAAAIAAYTSGAAVPLVGPVTTGPAFAAISAAFTAAQVALIASQKFEGSFTAGVAPSPPGLGTQDTTGGAGGPGGGTFNAPQFFGLGQGVFQNQGNERQQQVVVLENDITNVQNRVRVIENRATIG